MWLSAVHECDSHVQKTTFHSTFPHPLLSSLLTSLCDAVWASDVFLQFVFVTFPFGAEHPSFILRTLNSYMYVHQLLSLSEVEHSPDLTSHLLMLTLCVLLRKLYFFDNFINVYNWFLLLLTLVVSVVFLLPLVNPHSFQQISSLHFHFPVLFCDPLSLIMAIHWQPCGLTPGYTAEDNDSFSPSMHSWLVIEKGRVKLHKLFPCPWSFIDCANLVPIHPWL